jgi:hypothetical protein
MTSVMAPQRPTRYKEPAWDLAKEDAMSAATGFAPTPHGLLQTGTLDAAYALGYSAVTRQWVGVATVHDANEPCRRPAWIITGIGRSPAAAIDDLRRQLERERAWCALQARAPATAPKA